MRVRITYKVVDIIDIDDNIAREQGLDEAFDKAREISQTRACSDLIWDEENVEVLNTTSLS